MSIISISKSVTAKISKELNLTNDNQQIIEYGMINLLSQLLSIILLLITAAVFDTFKETLIIAVCSATLRKYSGGAHCSSPLRCGLLSMITVPLLVLLGKCIALLSPQVYISFVIIFSIISLAIVYIYSPNDSPAKPIKNKDKIKKLKVKSLLISGCIFLISITLLCLNYGQVSVLMTLGVLNQAVTLTRPGHILVEAFDSLLKIMKI